MPTEQIEKTVNSLNTLLNVKNLKGASGVLVAFITTVFIFIKLPPDQIQRLKEIWYILPIPSALVLIAWAVSAYISEIQNRTKVDMQINTNLTAIAGKFDLLVDKIDQLFDKFLDERMYLENRFDTLMDGQRKLYLILEKRGDYVHQGDTAEFRKE